MERTEKCVEREEIGAGLMVEKLKQGVFVGKKGSPCTPSLSWRLELPSQQNARSNNFPTSSTISARKLCANLWEIQPHHQQHTPLPNMNNPATSLRRRRRRRHLRDTVFEVHKQLAEPPDSPSDQVSSQLYVMFCNLFCVLFFSSKKLSFVPHFFFGLHC